MGYTMRLKLVRLAIGMDLKTYFEIDKVNKEYIKLYPLTLWSSLDQLVKYLGCLLALRTWLNNYSRMI